jgi:hypothetical protein
MTTKSKKEHETAPAPASKPEPGPPGPQGPTGPVGPAGPPGTVHPLSAAFLSGEFGQLGGGGGLQRQFVRWLKDQNRDFDLIDVSVKELVVQRAAALKMAPADYLEAVRQFAHLLASIF